MKQKIAALLLLFSFTIAGCGANDTTKAPAASSTAEATEVTLTFSAAASLKDALGDIQKDYEKTHSNVTLAIDYGGSGAIREKVVAGAPIDGVLLASEADTMKLVAADKVKDEDKLLENTLVLVKNKQNDLQSADLKDTLTNAAKIAIGNPETVPAGAYAKETMESLGIFADMGDNLVMASDVRQVLAYVEAGNVDCGFVYKTDALTSDKVEILAEIPADLHAPILYYTAIVADTKNADAMTAFLKELKSEDYAKILTDYGFTVVH